MKFVRIAGLCLAAMFALSMAVAGTASAAPHWLVCLEAHSGTTTTKWETHQCEKAASGGSWEWSEPSTELEVRTHGTLHLEVPDPIGGIVAILCSGTDVGFIGPGNKDRTTSITVEKCEPEEKCEKIEGNEGKAVPVNLPWKSELLETEGKIHDTIRNGGNGEPGWNATCKVSGLNVENVCTSEAGLTVVSNVNSSGSETPLLVLADFLEPNKPKANCTSSGKESGDVLGSIGILLANKWALAVSK